MSTPCSLLGRVMVSICVTGTAGVHAIRKWLDLSFDASLLFGAQPLGTLTGGNPPFQMGLDVCPFAGQPAICPVAFHRWRQPQSGSLNYILLQRKTVFPFLRPAAEALTGQPVRGPPLTVSNTASPVTGSEQDRTEGTWSDQRHCRQCLQLAPLSLHRRKQTGEAKLLSAVVDTTASSVNISSLCCTLLCWLTTPVSAGQQ